MRTCDCCNNDFLSTNPEHTICGRCTYENSRLEAEEALVDTPQSSDRRAPLLKAGIAVHQLGDVHETDAAGGPIPAADRAKWFVSARSDSALALIVVKIPLASSEAEAWELAVKHLQPALDSTPVP